MGNMADMCSGNRQACPPSPNLFGKLDTRTPPELALGEPLDLNNNLQWRKSEFYKKLRKRKRKKRRGKKNRVYYTLPVCSRDHIANENIKTRK